jgi:hypothetical protein
MATNPMITKPKYSLICLTMSDMSVQKHAKKRKYTLQCKQRDETSSLMAGGGVGEW